MKRTCAFLILNYNGSKLLQEALPSIIEVAKENNIENEVVVIDNGSTDDSENIVKELFPVVKWFKASANRFLISYNEYLVKTNHTNVFLLNNDVVLRPGSLSQLLNYFEKPDIFSVAPLVINPGNIPENGRTYIKWSQFRFKYEVVDLKYGLTATASTAAGLYDREKLLAMGGFDDMLYPMYGEEIDLSLRAYRRGWNILFDPSFVIDHIGGASINKSVNKTKRRISLVKNRHLLMIKHVHNNTKITGYILWNMLLLPVRLLSIDKGFIIGTFRALKQLSYAYQRRNEERQKAVLNDKQLYKKLRDLEYKSI